MKIWKDVEGERPSTPRPKPVFDPERIIAFLGAYVAAVYEADRTDRVATFGQGFKVSPSRLWKDDV